MLLNITFFYYLLFLVCNGIIINRFFFTLILLSYNLILILISIGCCARRVNCVVVEIQACTFCGVIHSIYDFSVA